MIDTIIRDGKVYTNISNLKEWDKNPRVVGPEAFERLKRQLTKHGIVKPLLVNQEGIVLGGNTRLRAFRELGETEVWISLIITKSEKEMLELNLVDNDNVGFYHDNDLANLIGELDVNEEDYGAMFEEPVVLADITREETEAKPKKQVKCPQCGAQFVP